MGHIIRLIGHKLARSFRVRSVSPDTRETTGAVQMEYTEADKKEDVKSSTGWAMPRNLQRRYEPVSPISPYRSRSSASCRAASTRSPRRLRRRRQRDRHRAGSWDASSSAVFAIAMAQISLGLPDSGRPLSLGLDPRQSFHRLGHGMAQPARPHHRARRHQCRHWPSSLPAPSGPLLGMTGTPHQSDRHLPRSSSPALRRLSTISASG